MDFGLVLQTDPPASRVVELMKRAEDNGFRYGWTFDSAVLWQEPFVIYSQILAQTSKLKVGPMVTNPGTRTWEVTASTFATLNDMFGNRTVCGIGRGDSAMRVAGRKPNTLARISEAIKVIRALGRGEEADLGGGTVVRFPWIKPGAEVPVWMAAYGPKALKTTGEEADGFILQLADLYLTQYMVQAVKDAAVAAGRDPDEVTICVAAPAYVTADDSPEALAHAREQCRCSAAWWATTSPTSSTSTAPTPARSPTNSPTTSRPARATTTPTTGAAATRTRGSCRTRSSTGSA